MVENGRRKDGRQGIDGECVVSKTTAWKTVRCEMCREEDGGMSDHFWWKLG